MKPKKYKIIKTELFKQQEKKLPPDVKKELNGALKEIAKDPMNAPNSMNLFSKPSPEELNNWLSKLKPQTIDLMLEYLRDKDCLNETGLKLAHDFWVGYIKKK
jgi:hypothetical protein